MYSTSEVEFCPRVYIYNLLVIGKTVNTNVVYSGTTEMKLEIVSTIIKRKLVQNVLHFMKKIQQN